MEVSSDVCVILPMGCHRDRDCQNEIFQSELRNEIDPEMIVNGTRNCVIEILHGSDTTLLQALCLDGIVNVHSRS